MHYGEESQQVVDLWLSSPSAPTAVLVHGGYWRAHLSKDLMGALVTHLRHLGWNVANVEYRRGSNGAWPAPREDVAAAVASVRQALPGSTLVGIGHSVGGQLVLLVAQDLDGVVGLAPVTDVLRTHAEDLGDRAAQEYFGATPHEAPDLYQDASPVLRASFSNTPTLVVHGDNDERVPVDHTWEYVQHRSETGHPVDVLLTPRLDHLSCIDTQHPAWRSIEVWLQRF